MISQKPLASDKRSLSTESDRSKCAETPSYTISPIINFAKLIKATPFQNYPSTLPSLANVQPKVKSPLVRYQFEPDHSVSDGVNEEKEEKEYESFFDSVVSKDNLSCCSGEFSQGILKTGRQSRFSVEGRRNSSRKNSSGTRVRITEPNDNKRKSLFHKQK